MGGLLFRGWPQLTSDMPGRWSGLSEQGDVRSRRDPRSSH